MKALLILAVALLAAGCSEEQKISGRPVSEWVDDLDDLDFYTRSKAWAHLTDSKPDLTKYRGDLSSMAKGGSLEAAWALDWFFGDSSYLPDEYRSKPEPADNWEGPTIAVDPNAEDAARD